MNYEVIIIGGGPAGLSAALILGRCLRKVLLIDSGKPRNAYSLKLHGYLTQDGLSPKDFIEKGKEELKRYETVECLNGEVISASKTNNGFTITTVEGKVYTSKKLLLATGVIDDIPRIEGIMDFYGKSVHTCPYCDAWEYRGKPLAVYGKAERGYKLALSLRQFTNDLVLVTNGQSEFKAEQLSDLEKFGIRLNDKKILRLEGKDQKLDRIVFEDGTQLPRSGLFFNTESFIRSKLLEQLMCDFNHATGVETGKYESTNVHGLFVAGNICREVQLIIVAAGEGAEAAFGINTALIHEEEYYPHNPNITESKKHPSSPYTCH